MPACASLPVSSPKSDAQSAAIYLPVLKCSRFKVGGGSYLSSQGPRVVLEIGKCTRFDWLEIQWPVPGGAVERFTDLPIDRYITIVEGQGISK